MHGARGQVECTRIEEEESSLAGGDSGGFGEADVVADAQTDAAIVGQVEDGDFVAGGEDVGFAEGDLAGDGDVEEVEFAVGGEEVALGGEEEGGVVVFGGSGVVLGNAAAE